MLPWVRVASVVLVGSVTLFVVLTGVAIANYPGGTWIQPDHPGFHWWHNFLCDLLMSPAINGVSSPVSALASQVAMLVLVVGLVPLWWLVPLQFADRDRWLAVVVRTSGLISVVGLVGVPLTTSVETAWLHGVFITAAGGPGFCASGAAVVGVMRSSHTPSWLRGLTLGAVVVSLADFGLYLHHFFFAPVNVDPLLPGLQKVAFALVLAWMVAVGMASWRRKAV